MKAITRRSFAKSTAALAALTAAGASVGAGWGPFEARAAQSDGEEETRIVPSACRQCYGRCSINGTVKDGVLVKVDGRPGTFSRGTICSKGFGIPGLVNSPLRVRYPMKRVGERGEGKWERISWEEAWDIIIPKTKEIIEQYGGNSIVHNFGTGRDQFLIGAVGSVWSQLGSVATFGVGNLCKIGGDMVQRTTIGGTCQFTGWNPEQTNLIIFWARGLFSWGAYDWLYIKEAQERGAKFMVVDPRATPATDKADFWVAPRPQSDMALILAIINEMLVSKRFDQAFAKEWTTAPFLLNDDGTMMLRESDIVEGGSQSKLAYWDENANDVRYWDTEALAWSDENHAPALFGSYEVAGVERKTALQAFADSIAEWTPAKASEVTWVPEGTVKEMIELYISSSPGVCFSRGQKTDFSDNTSGVSHAFTIMMALAGNYEVPGGNSVAQSNKRGGPAAMPRTPITPIAKEVAAHPDDYSINPGQFMIYGNIGATSGSTTRTMLTEDPVKLRMYWGQTADPIMSSAGAHDIEKAFRSLDFIVHVSLLMDPATELSDIVLPAAHPNEVDRVEFAQSGHCYPANATLTIRQPFTKPQGEARDDVDILLDFAQRMGVDYGTDKYGFLDKALAPCGMTFEEFREREVIQADPQPFGQHEKGLLRKDHRPGFQTATGKVNVFSEELSKFGHGPLPSYREQPENPVSDPELARDYPYVIIAGGRSHQFFHSEYHESPFMRDIHPYPLVEINPATAANEGIEDGDWVLIESKYGSIKQKARITTGIDPRVVHCEHDFWYPEKAADQGLHGVHDSNPNSLYTYDKEQDPAIGTNCFGTMVKISKAPDGAPEGIIEDAGDLQKFIADRDEQGSYAAEGEE